MIKYFLLLIPTLLVSTGCSQRGSSAPPEKTQLEVREFQTRTFEAGNHHLVMKSIINVLQDDGYMIKHASDTLGLLSATKEVGIGEAQWARAASAENGPRIVPASNFGFGLGFGLRNRFPPMRDVSRPTHELIEATVNVSEFGNKVRVRASFQDKVFDNHERTIRVKHITNEQFYQDFFAKVNKGIFIQEQNI